MPCDSFHVRRIDYFTAQGKIDSKRKKDLLTARYTDAKPQSRLTQQKDGEFTTDLEHFEMEQTAKAQLRAGALDRPVVEEEEYDFVFDESVQIQFAIDNEDRIEGTMSGKDAALQAQIQEAEKRGRLFNDRLTTPAYRRELTLLVITQLNRSTK